MAGLKAVLSSCHPKPGFQAGDVLVGLDGWEGPFDVERGEVERILYSLRALGAWTGVPYTKAGKSITGGREIEF